MATFTGDNNVDGGDAARWVHIAKGATAAAVSLPVHENLGLDGENPDTSMKANPPRACRRSTSPTVPRPDLSPRRQPVARNTGPFLPRRFSRRAGGSGIAFTLARALPPSGGRHQFVWSVLATTATSPRRRLLFQRLGRRQGLTNKGCITNYSTRNACRIRLLAK